MELFGAVITFWDAIKVFLPLSILIIIIFTKHDKRLIWLHIVLIIALILLTAYYYFFKSSGYIYKSFDISGIALFSSLAGTIAIAAKIATRIVNKGTLDWKIHVKSFLKELLVYAVLSIITWFLFLSFFYPTYPSGKSLWID